MADFQELYGDILDYMNRPSSEMLVQAKREANNALKWLQRKHMFKMTERLIRLTYPANTLFIDITEACEGQLRDIMNVFLLSGIDNTTGVPIKVMSYDAIMRQREQFQGKHEYHDDIDQINVPDFDTHSEHVRNTNRYHLFLTGENKLGLYPTPGQETYLMLNIHIWLPDLIANADTNFLLTYAYDVILMRAMITANFYLKEDRRINNNAEIFQDAMRSVFEWDASIRSPQR